MSPAAKAPRPARFFVRRLVGVGALILVAAVSSITANTPTAAAALPRDNGTIQNELSAASQGYLDAKSKLDAAIAEQALLRNSLTQMNAQVAVWKARVGLLAAAAYRSGPSMSLGALLNSASAADFLYRASALQEIAATNTATIRELADAKAQAAAQNAKLNAVIAAARNDEATMLARKQQALRILNFATGGPAGVVIAAPSAVPAPRNSDGTFPAQSCSEPDPTTSGCLTPRTLHAYQQVRAAGFNHYAACYRPATWGEHPLGRACDWAADPNGFGGVAYGASRDYGNRLAGWLIGNADRLGVLYVIWFKQIWLPGIGWRAYTTECCSPSGDHTNHVHMSIR